MPNPFNLTDRSVDSILNSLREFGYNSLNREGVIQALTRIEKKENISGDIIAMFIERDLRDAGLLK